jgi:hypothetical protein
MHRNRGGGWWEKEREERDKDEDFPVNRHTFFLFLSVTFSSCPYLLLILTRFVLRLSEMADDVERRRKKDREKVGRRSRWDRRKTREKGSV